MTRHEPNQQDAAAYDVVYLLAAAAQAGKVSGDPAKVAAERTAIRDALVGLKNYDALEGAISFDAARDAVKPTMSSR